ncbi:MAG: HAMP domain-containing protein [Chloroflexi bacterium]|nr:MAG: HAMP domain-containing protein [Chloroflexota bacterium]
MVKKSITNQLFDRFWVIAGGVNIRIKIIGIVLALVVLLGGAVTWQVRQLLSQAMYAQLTEQAVAFTRDLAARAADPILINDLYELYTLLQDTQNNHPNVRYAFILDNDGYVIAHTFDGGFPRELIHANSVTDNAYEHTAVINTNEGQIWDTAVPIFEGRAGVARLGLSDAQVRQTIDAVTGQLLLTTVLVSIIGITAAVFLTWILTYPILDLVEATQAVGRGDFSYRVKRWANDEIGKLTDAFNKMAQDLAQAEAERAGREQMRAQYVHAVITAQEDERKRIARELHDSTSQSLTSMIIGLKAMADTCQNSELQRQIEDLRMIAIQTLDDVHALSLQLRPSVLDDLGLPEAIRRHVLDCQRRNAIDIDLAIQGLDNGRLPSEIETALYRIVQEALTNIIRHAEAHTASIFIERQANQVIAVVEDDGIGFDQSILQWQDGHLGIYGIKERVELLSGQLTIETESGHGTSLFVEIPLTTEPVV